ncbi:uncharacterized protein LOC113316549 [Papaver somniferum]|uniref:uncharacterized protein LOC113316549 n=1 Tax=Papaver somniferum TaxID=3469 RepID=UPI000E6FB0D4|nr:uncharacterized protein LOC113316549 [Papaver somniferum]
MARIMRKGKLLLAYIKDRRARRVSYRHRSKGFVKLVSELCILCGADGCAIVCGPYPDLKPQAWPTDQPEMQHVLMKFNSISLEERHMKMLNHRSFLNNQITKLDDKSQKQERENRNEELSKIVRQALNGKRSAVNRTDLGDLNNTGNSTAIIMIPNPSTNYTRSYANRGYGMDNGFEFNGGVNAES